MQIESAPASSIRRAKSPPDHQPKNKNCSTPCLRLWCQHTLENRIVDPVALCLKVRLHSRKRWFRANETHNSASILEVGWGVPCRLVAFFNAFCFEEVSAVTFLQMLINFLRNDLQSGPQSNPQFGPPDHPSDHPSDHPPKNKTTETSSKQKCTERCNKSAWNGASGQPPK